MKTFDVAWLLTHLFLHYVHIVYTYHFLALCTHIVHYLFSEVFSCIMYTYCTPTYSPSYFLALCTHILHQPILRVIFLHYVHILYTYLFSELFSCIMYTYCTPTYSPRYFLALCTHIVHQPILQGIFLYYVHIVYTYLFSEVLNTDRLLCEEGR